MNKTLQQEKDFLLLIQRQYTVKSHATFKMTIKRA